MLIFYRRCSLGFSSQIFLIFWQPERVCHNKLSLLVLEIYFLWKLKMCQHWTSMKFSWFIKDFFFFHPSPSSQQHLEKIFLFLLAIHFFLEWYNQIWPGKRQWLQQLCKYSHCFKYSLNVWVLFPSPIFSFSKSFHKVKPDSQVLDIPVIPKSVWSDPDSLDCILVWLRSGSGSTVHLSRAPLQHPWCLTMVQPVWCCCSSDRAWPEVHLKHQKEPCGQ